jgi:hypothetical protein
MRAFAPRILLILPLLGGPASAGGWTFCVAEAARGKDIWITDVFPAARDRARLEVDLKAYLKGRGVAASDAQCPAPKNDRTEMVNAQFTAEAFHRKLGDALHEVVAPEFEPRR